MRSTLAALVIAVFAVSTPGCEGCDVKFIEISVENARPQSCSLDGVAPNSSTAPPVITSNLCSENPTDPLQGLDEEGFVGHNCTCADFTGGGSGSATFPAGVFQSALTQSGDPTSCKDDGFTDLSEDNRFAWDSCAKGAEVSGTTVGRLYNFGEDNDISFNMCPDPQSMRIFPLLYEPIELRSAESFHRPTKIAADAGFAVGRMHIEVQGCRFFDGTFSTAELPPSRTRPQPGDGVSVAGDWIIDDGHDNWSEIHEARAIATVKPVSDSVAVAFVNAFFADDSFQRDRIDLDVAVPRSTDPHLSKLTCTLDPSAQISPSCDDSAVPVSVSASSIHGACRITLTRPSSVTPLQYKCDSTCNDLDFAQQPHFVQCAFSQFSGVVRAEWVDPGDVWSCNCACSDPSAAGASFAVPVQGCVEAGLDPSNAADQATACQQVCGGTTCGAAPACAIGTCVPPDSAAATLVARGACEPSDPVPPLRVSSSGDYHVTFDPILSSATFSGIGTPITVPASGGAHVNVAADHGIIDLAQLSFALSSFDVNGEPVSGVSVFELERGIGALTTGTSYVFPSNTLVFAARGTGGGSTQATKLPAIPTDTQGVFDVQGKRFTLDVQIANPKGEGALAVHLEGHIDDVPPVAAASGATTECTSPTQTPVVLDAHASSDVDPGDSISHVQWFASNGAGLGNAPTLSFPLALGDSRDVTLHVYDQELGASEATVHASVVDTTPPSILVSPATMCLWPPDHKRVRLEVGTDIVATSSDACTAAPPPVRIISVVSNEPDNGLGDGDTSGDIAFSGNAICVRRERSGSGVGRTYTITYEATDASGNTSRRTSTVAVPHGRDGACVGGSTISDRAPCN